MGYGSDGEENRSQYEKPIRPEADKGREPNLVSGRMGTRMFSMGALLERILTAFNDEHTEESLREAQTRTQRLHLVLETVDYVLAVESVALSQEDKADLVRKAYSELFGYGPLDALFNDENVTTISLLGSDHASVRYGNGELTSIPPLFEDESHLRTILARLLMHAGAELRGDQPIVETGLVVHDRPACISLASPPVTMVLSADIRLHPKQTSSLDYLVENGFMTEEAARMLRAVIRSQYGMVIVGDTESGKTTLLNALALEIASDSLISVERAKEMRLPVKVEQMSARWRVGNQPEITFGEQITYALQKSPDCLLLDEVRADEPLTIAPLLEQPDPPRQFWAFRGAPDAKRLQSALGMLARRAALGQGETLVHALYERLPFVASVARIQGRLQLFSIGEWQSRVDSDYPDLVLLMQYREGAARPTGAVSARWLD